MSRWLSHCVTLAWLAVLVVAAFSAGAASEGAAQWLWPLVVVAAAVAQMLFNKAQESRRKQDREWLRAIIDAVPYPLFYKGLDSRYLGVNDVFSRTFGIGREQVKGRSDADLFGRAAHERFVAQDASLLASGRAGTFEELIDVGGEMRTFEARKTPFYDKDGALLGLVGVAVDVTDNRTQERELRSMNQRLQEALSLLEQSRIDFDLALQAGDLGVWRTEFSNDDLARDVTNLSGTGVEWDESARRIAGLPLGLPLTKRDILRIVHPEDRYRLWSVIVDAVRAGGGRVADFGRLVRPDGSIRTVAVRAAVTYWAAADGSGLVRGLTGILRDVTEEEATKAELERKAKEAQDAGQAKSRFLAMISHEIRTPMNGIIGMLELVLMQEMEAEQRRMLEGVRSSAFVLLAILNDILDFSKIEAGRLEVERAPYLLREVVESIASTWSGKAKSKGISFDLSVDTRVPACVLGDRVRLYQVLSNLVGNAVKFTHSGGVTVRVTAERTTRKSETMILFAVEDTGIGIDPAVQARLFEPFQQADVSTTRHYGGTGLGLSIVKSLAHAMGGEVACSSAPEVGSCFSVMLPLEAVAKPESIEGDAGFVLGSAASVKPNRDIEEAMGRLILVAEDNAMNREVIGRQIGALGYCADMVEDGEAAWARLHEGVRYGLLLVDGHMPKLDGYQLVERIRSHERGDRGARLQIVAITANAIASERERCLAVGMDECLTKPLAIAELSRVLRRYLPMQATQGVSLQESIAPAHDAEGCALLGEDDILFGPLRALAGGEASQWLQLIRVFESVAKSDLIALGEAVKLGDWRAVRDLAHRMKSTFAQVADARTSAAFAVLEHAADAELDSIGMSVLAAATEQASATLERARAILSEG